MCPGHAGSDVNGDVFVTQKCRHGISHHLKHFLSLLKNSSFLHYSPELIIPLEAKLYLGFLSSCSSLDGAVGQRLGPLV